MRIVQLAAIDSTQIRLLMTLNKSCKREGMDVHCVCTAGPYHKEIEKAGLNFHDIPIDRSIHITKNLKSIYLLIKLFKEIKPDIVHVHTPIASVLGRIAAKLAGIPVIIYTAHGFYFHEGMSKIQYHLFFNIEKYIGKFFTDYIFTQSEEDYKLAVKNNFLLKSKNQNYLHISNGIDLADKFSYERLNEDTNFDADKFKQSLGISENDIIVTFIGRLVREKGILDLLNAYNYLDSKIIKFIIIGELDTSERDQTAINDINEFKKNENIIFTGQVNNINEYLYISDIFCLPSYREGMPRSIIEAMAMKNAVIATNIRGSREEVVENETGYLVNIKSSESIAQKIDILANSPKLLNQFKEKGYRRAKSIYDEKDVISKQINVFNKVLIKEEVVDIANDL